MSEPPGSFFDRYPWTGALLFFGIIVVVGIFLSTTVGERPHYRSEWRFLTPLPNQGSVPGSAPFAADPVHVHVHLRVQHAAGEPALGLGARLVDPDGEVVLAEGFTSAPDGRLVLPVPARFDLPLFRGELVLALRRPDRSELRIPVPPPDRGRVLLEIDLSRHPTGPASGLVLDPEGSPAARALVLLEMVDRAAPSAPSLSVRSDERGAFSFPPAEIQGRLRATAYLDDHAARTDPLAPPAHGLVLKLAPCGGLRGEVGGAARGSVQRLGLADIEGDGQALLRTTEVREGRFRMDGLAAGRYRLWGLDAGGAREELGVAEVAPGAVQDLGVLGEAKR
jgi:hypothetical protein